MDATGTVRPTLEQRRIICEALIGGDTTRQAGLRVGRSQSWAAAVARQSGLVFSGTNQFDGKWTRKEQPTMTNGEWNLSTSDYEALLKPEREHTNGNGHTEAAATETATEQTPELNSIDDDIKEALDLLARAEQQRKQDMATIERLQIQGGKSDQALTKLQTKYTDLQTEASTLRTRIDQLEGENKRLMDKLKGEISRGLLRQGMDSLRKVL